MKSVNLLGVQVSRTNLDLATAQILAWVRQVMRTYVCVAPVATLVDAKRDKAYRDVVNRAGMVTPDGMPVVWLAHQKGCREVKRTYGPDLMNKVCQQGQAEGIKHYLYGANEATLEALKQKLYSQFPNIKIVGAYAPPFCSCAKQESKGIIDQINVSGADIVWVALGSPKQDFWMALNRPLLQAPVLMGVGAAFDFIAGIKPQAPVWMQRRGLEWLFRLAVEPRRLWKRYLIGNALFIFYVIVGIFVKDEAS